MSRDIPIIYSAPMVRALIEDRKTMTRRLAWREHETLYRGFTLPTGHHRNERTPTPWQKVKPGDRLWVRENWRFDRAKDETPPREVKEGAFVWYEADTGHWDRPYGNLRPCIHMPRVFSRLTLIVTATKIERLQAISEEDAAAEGIVTIERSARQHGRLDGYGLAGTDPAEANSTRIFAFEKLWASVHGIPSWRQNPEVVAISFRVIKANIDAPEAKAA